MIISPSAANAKQFLTSAFGQVLHRKYIIVLSLLNESRRAL